MQKTKAIIFGFRKLSVFTWSLLDLAQNCVSQMPIKLTLLDQI